MKQISVRNAEHRVRDFAIRAPQFALTALLLAAAVGPVFLGAQPVATETRRRIHLPEMVKTMDSEDWSDFRPAEAEEFPWAPSQQFWQGFISTSKVGQKSGFFIAVFDPHSKMSMNDIHQSAASSFEEDGAYLAESRNLTLSGYGAEKMDFGCDKGNGLYFTGGKTGTSVSFIYVALEKEKSTTIHPFLACYFAAPASSFDELSPVFDDYVKRITIDPLYGAITGRTISRASGIGIAGVTVQLLDSKTSRTITRLSASDGGYRFDSLAGGNYYLTLAEATGFKPQSQPAIVELAAGSDTAGIDFMMDQVEAPVVEPKAKPKPKPIPEGVPSSTEFGIGYRRRLADNWGIGAAARLDVLAPEVTFGLDTSGKLMTSLGASYFFRNEGGLRVGLGLFAGLGIEQGEQLRWSVELPLTAECLVVHGLSIQASLGPVLSAQGSKQTFSIGPRTMTGSLGFTWYFN